MNSIHIILNHFSCGVFNTFTFFFLIARSKISDFKNQNPKILDLEP